MRVKSRKNQLDRVLWPLIKEQQGKAGIFLGSSKSEVKDIRSRKGCWGLLSRWFSVELIWIKFLLWWQNSRVETWILVWERPGSVKMGRDILKEQRTCSLQIPAVDESHWRTYPIPPPWLLQAACSIQIGMESQRKVEKKLQSAWHLKKIKSYDIRGSNI